MSEQAIRVLLIEDNPGDACLIEIMLAEAESGARSLRFALERADRLQAGIERLQAGGVEIVLLDLSLPDSRGLETFNRLHAAAPLLPIIVLSGLDDEELAAEAVRQGAQDYLVKGQIHSDLLARAIRYAIERQRAGQALAWEANVNAAMAELSRALISPASVDEISALVLEQAKRLTGSAFGFVGYIDPQTGYFVSSTLTRDIWEACQVAGKTVVFHSFRGLWGWVLRNRRPLLTNAPAEDPRSEGMPAGHIPIERFLAVPALLGESLVGEIALANPGRPYEDRDLVVVERLASLYALAIQRQQAEAALQRYAGEQAVLYAVASAVSACLDPQHLSETVLDLVRHLLGADAGWVILANADPGLPGRVVAHVAPPELSLLDQKVVPLRDCPAYAAAWKGGGAEGGEPIDDCPHVSGALRDVGLLYHICVPLLARNQVQGVLRLAWRQDNRCSESDVALLLAIGRQVGMALHNARLYQEARQVDRLRVLNELDRALSATLDPERVAEVTLHSIARAVDASLGKLLLLPTADDGYPRRALTLGNGWMEQTEAEAQAWRALLECFGGQREAVVLMEGELAQFYAHGHQPEDGQWGSGIIVPIWGEQELVALLLLGGRPAARPFSDEDRALIQAAAGRAGQAIHNARLYDALSRLFREREEAQARLIHAEKLAALGRLIASIAHEINNPLQSIQGCLTLTREELAGPQRPEKIDRYLSIVEEEVERVSTIVRRLRDFYRPARTGFRPTDINAVLDSVLELSGKQLQHSGVQVERSYAAGLPAVVANPDHLRQVFLNLVLNAIDAMPNEGTLAVATAPAVLPGPGGQPPAPAVRVTFRDTGCGMPPEVLDRLFEPFFTTKEHGAGLGLAISYGIIQAHNGQITVESAVGQGTAFTILLPVGQPDGASTRDPI